MPFDDVRRKRKSNHEQLRRIYVGECGSVRVETRHSRLTFSPEEFVKLLRKIVMKEKRRNLPVLSKSNFGAVFTIAFCLIFLAGCAAQKSAEIDDKSERIITVGGSVTETVYALSEDAKLVGTDTSSVFPEAATRLPQVGYQRQLSAEGVLSLKPTLVLAIDEAGPPAAIQQIESAGLKTIKVSGENSIDGTKAKIREIAAALNAVEKGEQLIKKLDEDLQAARLCAESFDAKPKVLFIYARGGGTPQVSGANTAADAMIRLAGAENAITEFENFKPLTPEALVAAAPDFILLPSRALDGVGGVEGVLSLPGAGETPAGKNRRVIGVDDLVLLGFGPRTGAGVRELCEKLRQ